MWHRTSNLDAAVALAEQMKVSGAAKWFRGQTRTWPMLSSFVRKAPHERQAALDRIDEFYQWIRGLPALAELASNDDAVLAVAQHYGLATNLVDFTTDPRVAAFFATHDPPPPDDGEDESCIICLDYEELRELCESVKIVRPDIPIPKAITPSVSDLWRIQSQRGVFLEYPFDAGFERHTFGFDRIVFPTEREPSVVAKLIPVEDIYPTQKSDLEIHLDQFFMLERMKDRTKAIEEMARSGHVRIHRQQPVPDGIEAECFGPAGLPVHDSWEPSRLSDWRRAKSEEWQPISESTVVSIQYPDAGDSRHRIRMLKEELLDTLKHTNVRDCSINWTLDGLTADSSRIVRGMELTWDGLRRWPYDSAEIASALATVIEYGKLVDEKPNALHEPAQAKALAEQCLGEVLEVEIGIEDSSYTRAYANHRDLQEAVRDDFSSFLTEQWRPQIKGICHILQIAFNPRKAFVFDRLKVVFCAQIVPTQVVLRDESSGKARLFNATRATSLGLP